MIKGFLVLLALSMNFATAYAQQASVPLNRIGEGFFMAISKPESAVIPLVAIKHQKWFFNEQVKIYDFMQVACGDSWSLILGESTTMKAPRLLPDSIFNSGHSGAFDKTNSQTDGSIVPVCSLTSSVVALNADTLKITVTASKVNGMPDGKATSYELKRVSREAFRNYIVSRQNLTQAEIQRARERWKSGTSNDNMWNDYNSYCVALFGVTCPAAGIYPWYDNDTAKFLGK